MSTEFAPPEPAGVAQPVEEPTHERWGWREYPFRGGSLDGQSRHIKLPCEDGTPYIKIVTRERWVFDKPGERFVFDGIEPARAEG